MTSSSELTLDSKPPHQACSLHLKSSADQPFDLTMHKLQDFLSRLEDERLKINVFKRELPLCMQLLTNAVEASRQQLQAYRENEEAKPILEEFIPLKQSEISEEAQNMSDNKENWMTSAQIWSQASNNEVKPEFSSMASSKETNIGFNVNPSKLVIDTKQRNGGAFLPFSKDRILCRALPELALAPAEKENNEVPMRDNCSKMVTEQGKGSGETSQIDQMITTSSAANNSNGSQNQRKARRCWSPELHRRFVNALQMLGGSQVATPKQIRELMKVDGLTNDEVKSHLQKYRLHTRRPGPIPPAAGAPPPHLVVLGGIWVPSEYAATAHTGATAIYSPQAPPHSQAHYCTAPQLPQEFYAGQPSQPPLHHPLHLHRQLQVYKASSQTQSSPECDVRGAGDRSESIEYGKSDSSSWKAESGENGGERKGLAKLREDLGEDSNGSDITLKF